MQIGTTILKEFVELEAEKAERIARSKVDHKAVAAEVAHQVRQNCSFNNQADNICPQVKLAYMDDRKTKQLRDEREREQRAAREAAFAQQEALRASAPIEERESSSPSPTRGMPGSGHTLGALNDTPPPYINIDE